MFCCFIEVTMTVVNVKSVSDGPPEPAVITSLGLLEEGVSRIVGILEALRARPR